ncbi:hypothetical protein POM88_016350 [Heracleum sosnowskyi]|uniref:DUF4283 domain-containing protein n=1 Tax=Heracleum sosnowskyi TaxID=360622 RepID=A0AAD8MXA8_9APIA|nr:hypothetical protein POM88_016350 [Heracleum sosnowskyi]
MKKAENPSIEKPIRGGDGVSHSLEDNLDIDFPPLTHAKLDKPDEEVVIKNSWAKIVHDPLPPVINVSFKYCPRPAESSVVSPPVEVLREGNEKFENCIVGTFSKGVKSFNLVASSTRSAWEHRGLINVFQKDNHVFIFKFRSVEERNIVLARGTCKIPDCYWTSEGLSWLGSVIGRPLCADALTSKLEILPFAKFCVEYKIGDALPDKIDVWSLDPVSGAISISEVLIHYPVKPLVCTGCHSLGHPVGACPTTKWVWVAKRKQQEQQEECSVQKEKTEEQVPVKTHSVVDEAQTPVNTSAIETVAKQDVVFARSISEESPSLVFLFKNLKKVDEIDGKWQEFQMSKSQRKK